MSAVSSDLATSKDAISFKRRRFERRTLISAALSILAGVLSLIAAFPLFSVLYMLIMAGGSRLLAGGLSVFTELPPGAIAKSPDGGFGNALVGTVLMVGIAAIIAVPFGILGAILLSEYGRDSRSAVIIRFCAKILTGFPSILAGVFAYAVIVKMTGGFSALAGGVALSTLMLPIVMLTAEESMKLVPARMKHAAVGMGATEAQVIWQVTVPTALPGVLTGVMLAVARAAGETAPLLFTALYSMQSWPVNGYSPFVHVMEPTASMAVYIYENSNALSDNQKQLAWACSLILVLLVLVFNIGGQFVSRNSRLTQ